MHFMKILVDGLPFHRIQCDKNRRYTLKISKVILLGLLLTGVAVSAFAQVPADPATITGKDGVNLSSAVITTVKPLMVQPGTLVVIEGEGFGKVAGKVQVGTQVIDKFLSWDDTYIHFRVPNTLGIDSYVKVGNSVSESALQPAPAGSIKAIIVVDVSKVTPDGLSASQVSKLSTKDVSKLFQAPLYFKGSFSHSDGSFGFKDDMWGSGAKWRMLNAGGTVWVTEVLYTPDAIETFMNKNNPLIKPMVKFAFEDANLERTPLSEWESEFAICLKKSFQKQSGATGNDPTFYLLTEGPKSSWYSKKGLFGGYDAVIASYPVVKKAE